MGIYFSICLLNHFEVFLASYLVLSKLCPILYARNVDNIKMKCSNLILLKTPTPTKIGTRSCKILSVFFPRKHKVVLRRWWNKSIGITTCNLQVKITWTPHCQKWMVGHLTLPIFYTFGFTRIFLNEIVTNRQYRHIYMQSVFYVYLHLILKKIFKDKC